MRGLNHQQLQHKADEWIGLLYTQQTIINCQARRIQELEIAIATGTAQGIDHLQLAREIEAELGAQQMREPLRLRSQSGLVQALTQWLQRLTFNLPDNTRAG